MESRIVSRRTALRAGGVGTVVALAGCLGGDDENGDNGEDGATTEDGTSDAFTIGVLQDITGPNGPEFAHQGLTGLLSGFAYKNNRDAPMQLEDNPDARINWPGEGEEGEFEDFGTDPAEIMRELDGEALQYTVEDIPGAGDIEFEFLIRDTESDAETAANVATDLVEECDLLYGTSSSDGLVRVNNIVLSQTDIPLFVGQGSTSDVTSDANQCRDQLFRASESTAMISRAGAIDLVENDDFEEIVLLGVDSSFGRDVIDNYRQIFDAEGGVEYIERFVPVGLVTDGWADVLDEITTEQPGTDAIVLGFTGQTGNFFAEAFLEGDYDDIISISQAPSRLTQRDIATSALDSVEEEFGQRVIDDFVVNSLPFGPIACRYFWNQYDNETNDWFTDAHTESFGVVPDMFTASAFTSASAMVQAFEAAEEASTEAVLEEVPGMAVRDTPKGEEEYIFQEYNNQARSPITIAEYQVRDEPKWSAAIQPSEPTTAPIDKDVTTIPRDDPRMECDLS